ncbi:hypothetical protein BC834DRAFT_824156, partial [Gloeopeniophorella convolvens]
MRVYHLGALFGIFSQLRKGQQQLEHTRLSFQKMMNDFSTRLDETFTLTAEQRGTIRITAGKLIFEPGRINYMHLHTHVMTDLRQRQNELRLNNIFASLYRERQLAMAVKRICSSVRNGYREMLRDSVIGPSTMTLEDFIYNAASRFGYTDFSSSTSAATLAHVAILVSD